MVWTICIVAIFGIFDMVRASDLSRPSVNARLTSYFPCPISADGSSFTRSSHRSRSSRAAATSFGSFLLTFLFSLRPCSGQAHSGFSFGAFAGVAAAKRNLLREMA